MIFFETVEVKLPVEINEDGLKYIALDYKQYLKENNFKDSVVNFNNYYYDDSSNEYFYNFLFKYNLDFNIKDGDIENIYNEIKKYI